MARKVEQTEYIHTKTIESSGAIVRVFSPVLTEEERTRRMKAIRDAAAALLKEQMKNRKAIKI